MSQDDKNQNSCPAYGSTADATRTATSTIPNAERSTFLGLSNDQLKAKVESYVGEVWEDIVEDIRSLVQIDSVEDKPNAAPGMPWGPAPRKALDQGLTILDKLGLATTDVDGYLGFGDVPGATKDYIATIAHTDIVPTGKGWNYPALDVTRKEGYLIGRGVLDDKGPFVLSAYAAHFFARLVEESGEQLPYTLRCIVGNNEETHMNDVVEYLKRYPEPLFAFTPDADFSVICGEKGVYHGEFIFAEKDKATSKITFFDAGTVPNAIPSSATAVISLSNTGLVERFASLGVGEQTLSGDTSNITLERLDEDHLQITAHGIGGHASLPKETNNAIGILVRYLADSLHISDSDEPILGIARVLTEDYHGKAAGIASTDKVFGPLTCITGTIRTREQDGKLQFVETVDSRYPTSTTSEVITDRLSELAAKHNATYHVDADAVPFYIDPDCDEIKTLLSTYDEYSGKSSKAYVIGGGTYARHFKRACAFGPHDAEAPEPEWVGMEHGPDEAISEASLQLALKVYIVSLARLMQLELKS